MTSAEATARKGSKSRRVSALLAAALVLFAGSALALLSPLGTYRSILQEYVLPRDRVPTPIYMLRNVHEARRGFLRVFCRTGVTLGRPSVHGDVTFSPATEPAIRWMLADDGRELLVSHETNDTQHELTPITARELMLSAGFRGTDAQLEGIEQDFGHILQLIREGGPYGQTFRLDENDVPFDTGLRDFVPINPGPLLRVSSNEIAEWGTPSLAIGALVCLVAASYDALCRRSGKIAMPHV